MTPLLFIVKCVCSHVCCRGALLNNATVTPPLYNFLTQKRTHWPLLPTTQDILILILLPNNLMLSVLSCVVFRAFPYYIYFILNTILIRLKYPNSKDICYWWRSSFANVRYTPLYSTSLHANDGIDDNSVCPVAAASSIGVSIVRARHRIVSAAANSRCCIVPTRRVSSSTRIGALISKSVRVCVCVCI